MVRIATYNICYSTRINDTNENKYGWDKRWPCIKNNISATKADVICLQEVHSSFIEDIYSFANEEKYHVTVILFNKRKLTVKGFNYLCVLSTQKYPVVDYSIHNTTYIKSKKKAYPYMKVNFDEFSVINCHLSTEKTAKTNALQTLFGHEKTIIVGDFNTFDRHWKEMTEYIIEQKMSDATNVDDSLKPVIKTFSPFDYDYEPQGATSHLDHLYYKKTEFKITEFCEVICCKKSSDHFAAVADFELI